jgi:hypothetical protein
MVSRRCPRRARRCSIEVTSMAQSLSSLRLLNEYKQINCQLRERLITHDGLFVWLLLQVITGDLAW